MDTLYQAVKALNALRPCCILVADDGTCTFVDMDGHAHIFPDLDKLLDSVYDIHSDLAMIDKTKRTHK